VLEENPKFIKNDDAAMVTLQPSNLETLGVVPDQVTHTSDLVRCEQLAERLIMSSRACMDIAYTAVAAVTVATATPGFSSAELSCRGRPPSESLHLFRLLCVGYAEGQGVSAKLHVRRLCLRVSSYSHMTTA
jgi:hypothetical protein